ncbi:MAG TPA: helix-turn-helix domain-containing protein [Actinomycetota bacterium]
MRGAQFVREARHRAGLSQAELAARAGTTQSAIARVESGTEAPTLERVVELVRASGFDLQFRLVPLEEAEWAQVEALLRLTPAERVDRFEKVLELSSAGRRAVKEARRG